MLVDNSKFGESSGYIYGCDDTHIDRETLGVPVHKLLLAPLSMLQEDASREGFDLVVASGYRDFERQLKIWNEKARGVRVVNDDNDSAVDMTALSPWQKVQAILRWSALPGASRHHWGCDIDIFDRAAVEDGYNLKLEANEVSNSGPFGPMHQWLDRQIEKNSAYDFFRPYVAFGDGVGPERWHLSYAPLAVECQRALTVSGLAKFLRDKPIELKETVLEHLPEIHHRFVVVSKSHYPIKFRELI